MHFRDPLQIWEKQSGSGMYPIGDQFQAPIRFFFCHCFTLFPASLFSFQGMKALQSVNAFELILIKKCFAVMSIACGNGIKGAELARSKWLKTRLYYRSRRASPGGEWGSQKQPRPSFWTQTNHEKGYPWPKFQSAAENPGSNVFGRVRARRAKSSSRPLIWGCATPEH